MKFFGTLIPRWLSTPVASLIFSIIYLNSHALGQLNPVAATQLWSDWMENSSVTGPRLYIKTHRDILQSSWTAASFQRGSLDFVLADGAVGKVWRDQENILLYYDEWDTDKDGWRDVVEIAAKPPTNPLDSLPPYPAEKADVYWTTLANGRLLPVDLSAQSAPAKTVRPFSAPNVILSAATAGSTLVRPQSLNDYSTQFYIVNPATSSYALYGNSLYNLRKEYPNPIDAGRMEKDVLPGVYQVQFPLISNPAGRAGIYVSHTLVPNGTLTIGTYKKPSWLLRSAESIERVSQAPVPQTWVDGKLRFDPDLSTIFKWDNLVQNSLATLSDQITILIENEAGATIWPPTGASVITSPSNPQATLYCPQINDPLITFDQDTVQASRNGFLVLKYSRNLSAVNSGDVTTVNLRVPIEMKRSFTTYRKFAFPGADGEIDSISGPNADPDMDGLTNLEEFQGGGNPRVPNFAITSPVSAETIISPFSSIVNLGATLATDLDAPSVETIYERGVVYSPSATNPFPLIDGVGVSRVPDVSTDIGPFTVVAPDLTPGTQYSFHGYAITSNGVYYTSQTATFTTRSIPPVTLPSVSSPTSGSITGFTAILGGNVTSDGGTGALIERGVVFSRTSTNDNPFIGGAGVTKVVSGSLTTGVFTLSVTGLTPGFTYSFRAYAINSVGTAYTSSIGTFSAPDVPTVTSPTSTAISSTSAILGGNVTSTGGAAIQQRGVIFSATNSNPVIGGAGVTSLGATTGGTGVFTVNVTLVPGRTYFYKAYARNNSGVGYTPVTSFVTPAALPTLTAPTISNLTPSSATLGGHVSNDGAGAITERGFIYCKTATNSNPLVGGFGVSKVSVSGTTGLFSANITGLTENAGYTFKSYAINSAGIAYGAPYAFFTTPSVSIADATVSGITTNSAVLGGTVVLNVPTAEIIERGVVYSQTQINSLPALDGQGVYRVKHASSALGPFTVAVTGLLDDTLYSFSAYVITPSGTLYSAPVSIFRTLELPPVTIPTVISLASSSVTINSAFLAANVTDDGNSPITQRGFVYSVAEINSNPHLDEPGVTPVIVSGTTTGILSTILNGLDPDTTYSFRAYAMNSVGTTHTLEAGVFTTPPLAAPTLISQVSSGLTVSSSILGANLADDGNSPITEKGLVYSLTSQNPDPYLNGDSATSLTVPGTAIGEFASIVTGLQPGETYSFRAYAINGIGTGHTVQAGTFKTASLPTIISPTATNIASSSVTLGGDVTNDGGSAILERGVVFIPSNTDPLLGTPESLVAAMPGTGVFTVNIANLSPGTTYSYRVYAKNGGIPSYTEVAVFTTPVALAAINSPGLSNITSSSADLSAEVTDDGGATITGRGFVYSVTASNSNPTIGGSGVIQVPIAGTVGVLTSSISSLLANTQYTFKAYATNSAGTAHGAPSAFFTTLPIVLSGLAQVELVEGVDPQLAPSMQIAATAKSFTELATQTQPRLVPHFTYVKNDIEKTQRLTYQIKVSTDMKNWLSTDNDLWLVEDTEDVISCTWNSFDSPPLGMFFMVEATTN
jgi:hypothetical protein